MGLETIKSLIMITKTFFSYPFFFAALFVITSGCSSSEPSVSDEKTDVKTPVTLTHIQMEAMEETIDLNGVSSFLKKSSIKSTATGMVESIEINLGDYVKKGELLFTLKTKEAVALEKASPSDTSLNFKGLIKIKASKDGVISSISHHKGDYVQEADELAVIAEQNSLVFILEVPFELHQLIKIGQTCNIELADNQNIKGIISTSLPIMDIASQTENYIVKPTSTENLPENLIVKIKILKSLKSDAVVLPKAALLTNETQTDFWVMKMINDSIAIKVPVKKGLEDGNNVEILEPLFKVSDSILQTGNYGLPDTAKVSILKEK